MSVAAISDVHGNLPALEAVLAEIERIGVDAIVCCGDVAAGPLPRETCERLMALDDIRFVRGNADREMAAGEPPAWDTAQLEPRHRDFLAAISRMRAGGHPDLDELLRESLVDPTPADEVTRYFEFRLPGE
jgi:3',5'-cyclic AMP phosphodiesterase CpdA